MHRSVAKDMIKTILLTIDKAVSETVFSFCGNVIKVAVSCRYPHKSKHARRKK